MHTFIFQHPKLGNLVEITVMAPSLAVADEMLKQKLMLIATYSWINFNDLPAKEWTLYMEIPF